MPGLRLPVARSGGVGHFPAAVRRAKIKIEREAMNGIQFVTDEKGRKVAVQIDLRKYGAIWEDFWDGFVSESRRKEKGIPFERVKADLVKSGKRKP